MDIFDTAVAEDEEFITLGQYAEKAYLDYAVSVVKGRALPEVADGQKPVQRRILYAMHQMNLRANAKPVKSARVVGDVLGRFHPHGDQAAYEAMVRMAQNFTLRYPLIDGQGNFGSRDGDGAAAMRYTEARLTPIAQLLLDELGEGTVDFIANYDGTEKEPALLPARLPMMLLNGASGIAVGMATEIVPHNLREVARACVALLKKPKLSTEQVMEHITGPDFVNGGQIISDTSEIHNIYETGRGSLMVRARWTFEERARRQWQLVITELPPNTTAQRVLEEIEELTNPKIRGTRKSLTTEQQQNKNMMLSLLDTVRDESGKDAAVRLVFEPKSSKIDRDEFVNQLLAKTSLEGNVAVNLVCIGTDGRPAQKSLVSILNEWLEYRRLTVSRRTQYRLDKVIDRIHLLEGRMIVYLNVDEVIQTIRESDEPRPALMERFNLSDRQAEDILEMRLRQLAKLEGIKIEQELRDKLEQKAELEHLLANDSALKKLIIKEINEDAKKYGDDRRTLIETAEKAVAEVKVPDDPVTVIISKGGWLRSRQGHGSDPAQFNFKSGDSLYDSYEVRTPDSVVAIGDNGRSYALPVSELPSARGDGQPITAMVEVEAGSVIRHYLSGEPESEWLIAQNSGMGFKTHLKFMCSRQKTGKSFVKIDSEMLQPRRIGSEHTHLALFTSAGKLLVIDLKEVKSTSNGGVGTKLVRLGAQDTLQQAIPISAAGLVFTGTWRNKSVEKKLKIADLSDYTGSRGNTGRALDLQVKEPVLSAA